MADGTNICERCGGSTHIGAPPDRKPCPKCDGRGWYSYNIIHDDTKGPELRPGTQQALSSYMQGSESNG